MKIYFTGAISSADEQVRKNYKKIIETLEKMGHVVITHFDPTKTGDMLRSQTEKESLAVQRRLSKWKKQADLVLVEGSTPSFGVGQEITEALMNNKQVIVMYLKGKRPHILASVGEDALYFAEYTMDELADVLHEHIEYAKSRSDTRFNFFISPEIGAYLDWVAQKRKVPRAVYLRRLIEEDMKQNPEYNV